MYDARIEARRSDESGTGTAGFEPEIVNVPELIPGTSERLWVLMPPSHLGHPAIVLAFVAMLAALISIAASSHSFDGSPLTRTLWVQTDGTGWTVHDFDERSSDGFQMGVLGFSFEIYKVVERKGSWASTVEVTTIRENAPHGGVSPEILIGVGDHFESRGEAEAARLARAVPVVRSRVLWPGYLINIAIVGSAGMLVRSVVLFPRWRRSRRVRLAFAKSRCPGCGYSLIGTPVTDGITTCPECGDPSRLVSPMPR